MTSLQDEWQDQYAIISSFYGPGAAACWYLTFISVLLSWLFHAERSVSGFIDEDLIAIVTFPAVAAGHILWQIRYLLGSDKSPLKLQPSNILKISQALAAVGAPLSVIRTAIAIFPVIFLIATYKLHIRRMILTGILWLFYFVTQCLAYLAASYQLRERSHMSSNDHKYHDYFDSIQPLFAKYVSLAIRVLVIEFVFGLLGAALVIFTIKKKSTSLPQTDVELIRLQDLAMGAVPALQNTQGATRQRRTQDTRTSNADQMGIAKLYTRIFLFITALVTPLALALLTSALQWDNTHTVWDVLQNQSRQDSCFELDLASRAIPATAYLITDLDQAVAAATGAMILSLRLYAIANGWFKMWKTSRQDRETSR